MIDQTGLLNIWYQRTFIKDGYAYDHCNPPEVCRLRPFPSEKAGEKGQ
jgi:hypothetical protein